jgi:multidrug efflux system membrane fusion protein
VSILAENTARGAFVVAESERASILSRIRRMTAEGGGASDAQLLDRFAASRDAAAFELLLWRHARLVFGVCLRLLHDPHDAEDAFQATFLALARHAGRIAKGEAVAGWLHKVAYRVALTARGQRARRQAREQLIGTAEHLAATPAAEAAPESLELRRVLDQEIGRLPGRFRAAVVLCYLEGKSVDEAARQLGCPRGTVASRLARARARLRVRLDGRGLAMMAALAILSQANAAPRPLALIPTLTAAALRYAAGRAAAESTLSPRITALTEEVLRAMFLHKLKTGILVLVAFVGVLLAGGGLAGGLYAPGGLHAQPLSTGEVSEAQAAGQEQAGDKPIPSAPHPVTVSRPARREAAPYQDYTGHTEAASSVNLRARVTGYLTKVAFKGGSEVKQGDLLFEIDPRPYQAELAKAEANLAVAEAHLKRAEADVARVKAQLGKGSLSREDYDKVVGDRDEAAAGVAAASAVRELARLNLSFTRVSAPVGGRIGRQLVDPGNIVKADDTVLATIVSKDPMYAYFDVDERTVLELRQAITSGKIRDELPVAIGLANKAGFPLPAKIDFVNNSVDPTAGTLHVRAVLPNAAGLLLPGMFVRVRLTVGPPRAVLEVPEEAILTDQGKKYVLVVGEGGIAQRRAVTLGWADGGMRVVEKGLGAEDWVVIAGLVGVQPGEKVEPRKNATPAREGASPDPGP